MGITKTVNIPDVGDAQVTLKKAGGIHERYWRDVVIDVVLPGETKAVTVECKAGDRGRNIINYPSLEVKAKFEAIEQQSNGYSASDMAMMAVQQIIEDFYASRGEETLEFSDIENDHILLRDHDDDENQGGGGQQVGQTAAPAGPVKVDVTIYDNTEVSAEEMVSTLLDSFPGAFWFTMLPMGWIGVDHDPASIDPSAPVEGAPFEEKTWGETLANGYVAEGTDGNGKFDWKHYAYPGQVLEQDDSILWYMLGAQSEQEKQNLIASLEEHGLDEVAAKVETMI